jgi:hypothetical protein
MPSAHKYYKERLGWNADYFIEKSSPIGPATQALITKITSSAQITEQTYRTCVGILRLEAKYGKERLESACRLALKGSVFNYGIVSTILSNNRDKLEKQDPLPTIPLHENIRGKQTYILFNN